MNREGVDRLFQALRAIRATGRPFTRAERARVEKVRQLALAEARRMVEIADSLADLLDGDAVVVN